jgi:hypothetical protein
MKVYYIKHNETGELYGNARYFSPTAVPKLYGTRRRAQSIIDDAVKWRSLGHVAGIIADAHVVEGELP